MDQAAQGMGQTALAELAAHLRQADPDRFFCALLAPQAARPSLFTLYAFNHELARAREAAREPGLALIRLHWWREVVEGAARAHPVATPLRALIAGGQLSPAPLLAMIDAREAECADSIEDLAAWHAYLRGRGGALAEAAGEILGADTRQSARLTDLGAAYAGVGVIRSAVLLARAQRCLLPRDTLAAHGLSPEAVIAGRPLPAACLRTLAQPLALWLGQPAPLGKAAAAGLPAVLARRDLRRFDQPPAPRGLGDRLAVLWAARRGRV